MTLPAEVARRPCWQATVRQPAVWIAALAGGTVLSALKFWYVYLDDLTRAQHGTFARRLIEEMGGVYYALPMVVAIVALAWCYPINRSTWRRALSLHAAALVGFSIIHTSLHWIVRTTLFPLLGLGPYDYGLMPLRYLMEFPNDTIGYCAVVLVVEAVRYYRTLRDRELALAQAQLRNLRLQLQPHFLFNALNTISATMYDDPAAADGMIAELSELLRVSLKTVHTQEVPLHAELEALGHYTALMQARFGDQLSVDVDVDAMAAEALVPSLILQPLVENAVRHGNASRIGRGHIDVRARRHGDRLTIDVVDDGPGIATDAPGLISTVSGESPGIGLRATAERLKLLYGDAHQFSAGNAVNQVRAGNAANQVSAGNATSQVSAGNVGDQFGADSSHVGFVVAINIPYRPCAS